MSPVPRPRPEPLRRIGLSHEEIFGDPSRDPHTFPNTAVRARRAMHWWPTAWQLDRYRTARPTPGGTRT